MKKRTRLGLFMMMAGVLLSVSLPANAVGFMVNPMSIDLAPQPGTEVVQKIILRNTQKEASQFIDVKLMELTQDANGTWRALDPTSDPIPESVRSCREWISFDIVSAKVPPLQTAEVALNFTVPRGARGTYAAAFIAQTRPKPDAQGLGVIIRFLIPIIIEIQGRSVRLEADLIDTGIAYREALKDKPGSTLLSMTVSNTGQTLVRFKGEARLYHFTAGNWRRVCSTTFAERRVLPGHTINRSSDLERRLPSGKYKSVTAMHVGGRRYKPITKEIDFIGDPTVGAVPVDVAISVDPPQLEIQGVPGARRSAYLTLENPTETPVEVRCSVSQPEALSGVMMGDTTGDDFSCHTWTAINPPLFMLRSGGKRKVAVQVTYPKPGNKKPYSYANFNIAATYPDGQTAGSVKGLIIAQNKMVEATSRMHGMGLALARLEGEQYTLTATIGNTGDTHLAPSKPRGNVLEIEGISQRAVSVIEFSEERDMLLPLGIGRFSGTIDFSTVKTGAYVISVVTEHNGGETEQTILIEVKVDENEGKVVDVVGLAPTQEEQATE